MLHPSLQDSDLSAWRQRLKPLEDRLRPFAPATAFVTGFVYDSLTLDRIDKLNDNLQIIAYLVGLGVLLVLRKRVGLHPDRYRVLREFYDWMPIGVQFFFGGLFSAYVVFGFKSASATRAGISLVLLVVLLVGNEFLSHRMRLERLHVALYGLCGFAMLLFLLPVVTGSLGAGIFAGALAGGFALAMGLAFALDHAVEPRPPAVDTLRRNGPGSVGVLAGVLLLDLVGAIPPIPLAIMEGGIFHDVRWVDEGTEVRWEEPRFRIWPRDDARFSWRDGDQAWCFTAVFAPEGLNTPIVHRWEWWDEEHGAWLESDRIPFKVKGGREGGYRGYTRKKHLRPGQWRVTVESERGRVLGRYDFDVVPGADERERVWRTRIVR